MAKKKKSNKAKVINYFPPGFWKDKLLPGTLIFILALGLYAYSINFEFVLDDGIVLAKNELVKNGVSSIPEILTSESFSGYFGGEQKDLLVGARYRPLSLISFAIEYQLFGDNPMGFHILNVLFYGLISLLVYRILFLIFPQTKPQWFWSIPFIATLLFVTHPVHVEVVANIKSRDELYGLALSLGTLYFILKYIQSRKIIQLVWAMIAFWMALLAKENAATFLAVIPLTVYYFRKVNWKTIGIITTPLIIAFCVYFAMRYDAIGYIAGRDPETLSVMNNPFKGMTLGERLATIFYTLLLYLKLLFFPHPLTHDYYPYQIPIMNWSKLGSLAGLLAYLSLGVIALKGIFKKSKISYLIWYFLLTLFIVSNLLVPIGTFMNERFLFMPSVAFCALVAIFLTEHLPVWTNGRAASYVLLGLLILGYTARTVTRVPVWRTGDTLNEASILVSKNSARANLFYGNVLFQRGLKEENREEKISLFQDAEQFFVRSEEILPSYSEPIRMRAGVAAELFNLDRDIDKLLDSFYKAIQRNPRIQFIPTYVEYLNRRGQYIEELKSFYFTVGWNYLVNQRQIYDVGLKYLLYGNQIDPNDQNIRQAIGQTYLKMGDQANASRFLNSQ